MLSGSANLDLASINPELDIYDTEWPIWTYQRQLPPAKFIAGQATASHGLAVNTIVSGGCIVSGSHVANSVLFSNVRIHSFCHVEDAGGAAGRDRSQRHCRVKQGRHRPRLHAARGPGGRRGPGGSTHSASSAPPTVCA